MIRVRLVLCSLILLTSTFCPAAVVCWVSLSPGGEAVSWISTNTPLEDSRSVAWLNASIQPGSSRASFAFSYNGSSIDVKLIEKFVAPPAVISTPLMMGFTGFSGGAETTAVFTAKDDFSKCTTMIESTYVASESLDVPRVIPDNGTTQSTLEVVGVSTIQRMRVAIWLRHTFLADLDISLMGPDGTTIVLTSDNGSLLNNIGAGCTQRAYFDDEADASIIGAAGPFLGLYRPEAPLSGFAGKTGTDANGTWTLQITDDLPGDTGELMAWTIAIDQP